MESDVIVPSIVYQEEKRIHRDRRFIREQLNHYITLFGVQRGNILFVFLHRHRRAGSVLSFAQRDQLDNVVDAVIVARPDVDLSINSR